MRGKFIVFEGCDRSGKTTQCNALLKALNFAKLIKSPNKESGAKLIKFPNRESETGKLIDKYLNNKVDFHNNVIHLLFSANRWELMASIEKDLEDGITVICDRYFYSGIVYSLSKGLDKEWCIQSDKGIIKPDLIFFMDIDIDKIIIREGFGNEKYERLEFQKKVYKEFKSLLFDCEKEISEPNVKLIDASQSINKIHKIIMKHVDELKVDKIERL